MIFKQFIIFILSLFLGHNHHRAGRIKSHPGQDYNYKGQDNVYLKIDEKKIKYHRNRYTGEFIVLSDIQSCANIVN
jgi:hypothetical protein